MKEQLFIKNNFIPLTKGLNPSIDRSITDIKQPDKRKSDFSKTVTVPNSKTAAKVFGNIFELNVVDGSFNPLVKADCLYLADGEVIIDGYCKLKSISRVGEDDIEYNIVLFGSVANIFRAMGEKQLSELAEFNIPNSNPPLPDTENQLARWNHPFTREIQELSWDTSVYDSSVSSLIPFSLGTGYVYGLADYGLTTDLNFFKTEHIPFCLYAKEYIDALFSSNNFSYSSNFFDSDYFKSIVIPSDPSNYQLDSDDIDERQFQANTPTLLSTGTPTSGNLPKVSYSTPETIVFTNELSDTGNNYNPATGEWVNVYAGNYNLTGLIQIDATFTPSTAQSVTSVSEIDGRLELVVNGNVVNSQAFRIRYDDFPLPTSIGVRSTNTSPTYPSNQHLSDLSFSQVTNPFFAVVSPLSQNPPNLYTATFSNVDIPAGAVCKIQYKARYLGLGADSNKMFRNTVGGYFGGDATITFTTGAIFNKVNNNYPYAGNTVQVSKLIPKEVKQREFFKGIVNMFNLYVSPDPTNPRNLIIEPRDDYYNNNIIDLTDKIDLSRPIVTNPIGNLNASEYIYKYKDDVDYYNKKYTENWIRSYGDRKVQIDSDFTKKEYKTEVIFSPTPSVAPPQKNKVLPTIIGVTENNEPKTTKNNIRILFYGGLKDTIDPWTHYESTFSFTTQNQYPYMGHFDDPFNATEDLNFGLVKEVYYDDTIEPITVTNNNLYNKYHKKFIDEITNRNSKTVDAWVYITPSDFKQWDFRSQYFFENSYYRLQEIKGYNPVSNGLTKCKFLQIREADVFEFTLEPIDGGGVPIGGGTGGVTDGETVPVKGKSSNQHPDGNNHAGGGDKSVVGDNNYIASDSYNIKIQGDNNKIYSRATNITLDNSHNNTIDSGVKNVTLINTSGLEIIESDVTYINRVKVNPDSISDPTEVKEVSLTQNVEVNVKTYEVDTSGGDVSMIFDLASVTYTEGQVWNFKKMEKQNKLIIRINGGTIDGELRQTINKQYTNRAVQFDGTNFIIL